jgi:predicted phage terminase large subunit-like protein
MESIKLELENNERILEDFGDQRGKVWTGRKIVLNNGNALAVLGAKQSIRGIKDRYRRPTHVICDDLLKDDEVESASRREFLYKWFKRVVLNLGKDALIGVVNTIMHPDDLPSRLKQEIKEGQLKDWVCLWLAAKDASGRPIWPERWSLEDLARKEEELGTEVYATEMDNNPLPEASKKFRREWFVYYEVGDLDLSELNVVCAVDPATGAEAGDYTAVVVIGAPKRGQPIFVLEAWAERCSDMELIKKLVDVHRTFRPKVILFEEQNFQKIYKNLCIREVYQQHKVRLPVQGVRQSTKKALRIASLSPLVEAGIIRFRKHQKLLLEQLEYFPKGHDDLPDALEMAVSALEAGKKEPIACSRTLRSKSKEIVSAFRRFYGC